MKTLPHSIRIACGTLTLTLSLALPSLAQTVVKETRETTGPVSTETVTTTGTLSEFGGERFSVLTETSASPLTYRFSRTTTYVDEAGNPVSIETVKSGLPVTVHYVRDGNDLVARKVVVRKTTTTAPAPAATTETTTTTTLGTVSDFDSERLVVRTEASSAPLTYRFSRTTSYVDEAGAPVSLELIKSGLPVTVHYVKDGDALIAKKVILRKVSTVPPTTTTETTTTTADGTTTTGTISEFGGERLVVQSESSASPLVYRFSRTTLYVDEAGNPVSVETVKSGLPVTVHYVKEGNALIARKVIVRRTTTTGPPLATAQTTTSTTTSGTISDFGADRLLVRTESSTEPVAYRFSKTTTYVDDSGTPVSVETIKSGLPVTVHYIKDGDALIARKVVVKKTTTTTTPARTTTTTEKKTITGKTTTKEKKSTGEKPPKAVPVPEPALGTVNEFTPERIIVQSESSPDPVVYSSTKTTTYVDESGAPVPVEVVRSGAPVTVHYTTEGDARVATKVIVHKRTTTVIPPR